MSSNEVWASAAQEAVAKHPDSHVEVAMDFMKQVCPKYLSQSNDCLVKMGRRIQHLVEAKYNLQEALEQLVQECSLMASDKVQVPKVRFGKTELQMPILTLGCMRFQMEWGPRITNMNQVGSDCQDNLVRILKHAFSLGINHIETARGYGSSELQLGVALQQLIATGHVKREEIILQTKVPPKENPEEFREMLETSFKNLQVDYVDLFSFHGVNVDEQYDWVFDGCWNVIQEYVDLGKIRHVGFSTHAHPDLIKKLILTKKFEYANLHYHYFGSYTATGSGPNGTGNLENVRLMNELDMGVFVISPYDKGGAVYAPSKKLTSLTLPEMDPMQFASAWLWNHDALDEKGAGIHTIVCGAARPSDLDLPAVSAHLQATEKDSMLEKVQRVTQRLEQAQVDALGKDWPASCYTGIGHSSESRHAVSHTTIIWLYNVIKSFGLLEFAKNRYQMLESREWDKSWSMEENIAKLSPGWAWVPGRVPEEGVDYSDDFEGVPSENMQRVLEAAEFVRYWCAKKVDEKTEEKESDDDKECKESDAANVPPAEWETAYDMRPWPDFPDRKAA